MCAEGFNRKEKTESTEMEEKKIIEQLLAGYPIYQYSFFQTRDLDINSRVREICRTECERYGTSWSCPPAVGTVEECREKILNYPEGLLFSTVAEVHNILDMKETLSTRFAHEEITVSVERKMRKNGFDVLTLSSESCAICSSCAYPGAPCRHPDRMHPCIESHGIVVSSLVEKLKMDYYLGEQILLWFSLILFRKR